LAYQWLKNGSTLTNNGVVGGATTANLTLSGVQAPDAGNYSVVVSSDYGTVTSNAAVLTVQSAYTAWLAGFPGLSDTTLAGDPEGDGIPNLAEYAFSLDPTASSTSGLPVVQVTAFNGQSHLQIQFRCDAARTDITYRVEVSNSLAPAGWTEIALSVGGAPTTDIGGGTAAIADSGIGLRTVTVTTATTVAASPKQFVRVRISQP